MKDVLIAALLPFFKENYPDMLSGLEGNGQPDAFLLEQVTLLNPLISQFEGMDLPVWEMTEQCLLALSAHYGPSRYHYLAAVLEEDFPELYLDCQAAGVLHTELLALVERCHADFELFNFREDEDNRLLRYAIIEQVQSYCEEGEVIAANLISDGLQ